MTYSNQTKVNWFGYTFYENPVYGDEAPLMVKSNGQYYETDLFDKPCDKQEALDAYNDALAGIPLSLPFDVS